MPLKLNQSENTVVNKVNVEAIYSSKRRFFLKSPLFYLMLTLALFFGFGISYIFKNLQLTNGIFTKEIGNASQNTATQRPIYSLDKLQFRDISGLFKNSLNNGDKALVVYATAAQNPPPLLYIFTYSSEIYELEVEPGKIDRIDDSKIYFLHINKAERVYNVPSRAIFFILDGNKSAIPVETDYAKVVTSGNKLSLLFNLKEKVGGKQQVIAVFSTLPPNFVQDVGYFDGLVQDYDKASTKFGLVTGLRDGSQKIFDLNIGERTKIISVADLL